MPIRFEPLLDLRADRMPVHDDAAVVGLVEQEGLADPAQVRLELLIDRDAGTNAGVHEQIIAEAAGIDEAPQELLMLLAGSPP